ncbi:hypothetical protein [Clostridium sp.]|uniref:hypothetical protein n=1 Tax=Clostridium sp. TaxID=1506 RepID=UPI001D7403FC|nr:hypothetical protein [Clostridium sp.]MBS5937734.1 hypothetical protein [Clostridium sp.]
MKTLKFGDYIEIRKPTYIFIKITSHKSIRNFNSTQIAKMIALTYKTLNKKMYKEQKKFIIECNFKISYVIDIVENNANFYFIIPKIIRSELLEKINEIWSKSTIEEVENPFENITQDFIYEVRTTKDDALSLAYDKKSNDPLNYILSVMDVMKSDDRVTMISNFMPRSQFGWIEEYNETMEKVKQNKSLEKATMTPAYIMKMTLLGVISVLDKITEVLCDFTGSENNDKQSLYSAIIGVLEQQRELSSNTKNKKQALIIPTQIAVCSNKEELCNSVSQSLKVLDEDNEIIYRAVKKKINILDYDFNISKNIFSVDEISSYIKIPGKALLMQHGINHIKVEENNIPKKLQSGTKRLGEATYKGNKIPTFLDTEWNSANTSLTCVGGQGAGKTTFLCNYARDCIKANESVIVLDFIKNCELSEDIAKVTPKDRLIKINLAEESDIQAFSYNEIKIDEHMSVYKKLDIASMQSEQLMSLIDAISIGDPLSSSMRRLFNSACIIVGVQGNNSLKNVIDCLENYKKRKEYIDSLNEELKAELEDEINTLQEIDEYDKQGNVVGTKSAKISFILDRVDLLRSNFKLKCMYKGNVKNNIDIKKCIDGNKVILIQMRDSDFPTKLQKNILVTFWITKVWLACQLRGREQEKPNRCNFIIDEVFQAPTSLSILEYILVQARKFALKPVLSVHYIRQISNIFEALVTSNGSFMLMKGCTEDDFNYLKNRIDNLEYEDLKDMKPYNSLNLINYSDGYSSFITKLPKPI